MSSERLNLRVAIIAESQCRAGARRTRSRIAVPGWSPVDPSQNHSAGLEEAVAKVGDEQSVL